MNQNTITSNEYDFSNMEELLDEEINLFNILSQPNIKNDNPLIPKLRAIKGELAFRKNCGNLLSNTHLCVRLLNIIYYEQGKRIKNYRKM
jgi:hypothetical protein